jgi:hypothetical protein
MKVTYYADDGYVCGDRPLHCKINDDEIKDCESDEEALKMVEEIVEEDFHQKVLCGYSGHQLLAQIKEIRRS